MGYTALLAGTGVLRHGICYQGSLLQTLPKPLVDHMVYAEVLGRGARVCSPPPLLQESR